jgi:hypothetical protein
MKCVAVLILVTWSSTHAWSDETPASTVASDPTEAASPSEDDALNDSSSPSADIQPPESTALTSDGAGDATSPAVEADTPIDTSPSTSNEASPVEAGLQPPFLDHTNTLGQLVNQAVAEAESASEKAGVKYYGKERTGVLGNRLWFLDAGVGIPGDYEDEGLDLDPAPSISSGFNFPLVPHIDLGFGVAYSRQSGTALVYQQVPYTVYDLYYSYYYYYYVPRTVYQTIVVEEDIEIDTFTANGTLSLCLLPDAVFNPFVIGGAFYIDQQVDIAGSSSSANDNGYLYGGGVELKLGKKASLIPSVVHTEVDEAEETSVGAMLAYWYAFKHAVRFNVAYATEAESTLLSIGWMYNL